MYADDVELYTKVVIFIRQYDYGLKLNLNKQMISLFICYY